MKKNIVRLNETQLHKVIAESVKMVLNESEPWNEEPYSKKRAIHTPDPADYGPSDLEEELDDELYSLIDGYKDNFLARGWNINEFKSLCHDIVDRAAK